MVSSQIQQSDASRIWMIPFAAGPANSPRYEGLARAGQPEDPRGDVSPIWIPDPDRYQTFKIAGIVRGDRGLPNLTITWWYPLDAQSVHDRYVKSNCPHDIYVFMGICEDPQDFNNGWQKILVMQSAFPTSWSTTNNLGALQPSDRESVMEEVPFMGMELYHIYRMAFGQQAESEVVQEIIDIVNCDSPSCGICGRTSQGCDLIFALTLSNAGSPGLPAELLFTQDGGLIWTDTLITTLAANEDPNALACIGANVVVISEDSESLHYAPIEDIFAGTETWTEVTTGFVATNGPLAIVAPSSRFVWIVGENGYIYFTNDPTSGVTAQSPGSVVTENLNDVHAFDIENVVAVGNSNTVVRTINGGTTWEALTGPNVGVNLTAIWMRGVEEWFVGDATGRLWFTVDGGITWTEKAFPGAGTGQVDDIKFANANVGYMSHRNATPAGRILRTIDGGFSWYVAPEGNLTMPANDHLNAVAPCPANPNVVFAGGLADDATDGIIIKGSNDTPT